MGFFGRLFGPRKPPPWARDAFGDDGERFERFVYAITDTLAKRRATVTDAAVRTGSVVLVTKKGERELIFDDLARRCAKVDEAEWPRHIHELFDGRETFAEIEPQPEASSGKAWIIGAAPWGGVMFEAGAQAMVLVVLPTREPMPAPPTMPRGLVAKIVVCNANTEGHLAASVIARAAGLSQVHAIDPALPIDRGGEPTTAVEVKPLRSLKVGPLAIEKLGNSVVGRWSDGVSFLAGDAVLFSQLAEITPQYVVGKIVFDPYDDTKIVDALLRMKRVLIVASVPGIEARRIAKVMSTMGVTSEIVGEPPPTRRMQVLAHMIAGDFDRAATIAREAIAAGDEAEDMHHQLGMIALMRGDDAAADVELAKIDTAQALTSRAIIAARRGDRAALEMIERAVERLPGDEIALHARDAIRATLDDPASTPMHRFPEHAQLALEAVAPLIDEGKLAEAEVMLRRARTWDPNNVAITAELGYALSQLDRDADAIALYDQAIADGGLLLHFNRGNCRLRLERFTDAAADFRACLAIKPDWDDARVNLVSALFAGGNVAGARSELAELRTRGASPDLIRGLEQMLG